MSPVVPFPTPRPFLPPITQQHKDAAKALIRNPHTTPVIEGNPTLQSAVQRVREGLDDHDRRVFARAVQRSAKSVEAMQLGIARKITSEELKVSAGIPSPLDLAKALVADPSRLPVVEEGDLQTALRRVADGFSAEERGFIITAGAQPPESAYRIALEQKIGVRIGKEERTVFFESIDAEVGLGG